MSTLLLGVGFGLVTAATISLAAVALSLQFSVTHIPNFAHGEIITFGAYGALAAQQITHNLFFDAVAGIAAAGLTAWACNRLVLQSFIKMGTRPISLLIVTAGLSLILQNGLSFFVGAEPKQLALPSGTNVAHHVGPFSWTVQDITVMVVSLICVFAVQGVLRYTPFGRAQRAVSDLPDLARASGINVDRVVNQTWLLSGGVAGLAGVTLAISNGTLYPTMGFQLLLVVFAAAILGGIGNPMGALVGALVIGIATEVWAIYLNSAYKTALAVGVLVVVLLFRPNGLLGTTQTVE